MEFPSRGGMETTIVDAGKCRDFNKLGASNDIEQINVFGIKGSSQFKVQSGLFRPSKGGIVETYGTEGNAWAATPAV